MADHICDVHAKAWDVAFEEHELDHYGAAVGYEGSVGDYYGAEDGLPGGLFEEAALVGYQGFGHLETIYVSFCIFAGWIM